MWAKECFDVIVDHAQTTPTHPVWSYSWGETLWLYKYADLAEAHDTTFLTTHSDLVRGVVGQLVWSTLPQPLIHHHLASRLTGVVQGEPQLSGSRDEAGEGGGDRQPHSTPVLCSPSFQVG